MLKLMIFALVLVLSLNNVDSKYNLNKLQKNYVSYKLNDKAKFSFSSCGPSSDPVVLNSLTIQPDPVKVPGQITFSGDVSLKQNITGPLRLQLKITKIVEHFKVKIPCVDNFGSCTYEDVCSQLPQPDNCPTFFKQQNIPCSCPFPLGGYTANNVQMDLKLPGKVKIPPGEYLIEADFTSKTIGHVACYDFSLFISS